MLKIENDFLTFHLLKDSNIFSKNRLNLLETILDVC